MAEQKNVKIKIKGLNYLNSTQKSRMNVFHDFIFTSMVDSQGCIYFSKFLDLQFTTFPLAKGYPVISSKCKYPSCYFYIDLDQSKILEHNFLQFLNKEINQLKCRCGETLNDRNDFVYDSALQGLFQLKLSEDSFLNLRQIQITKSHELYYDSHDFFKETFNSVRLKIISQTVNRLKLQNNDNTIKQQKVVAQCSKIVGKTMLIKSNMILQDLEYKMATFPDIIGQPTFLSSYIQQKNDKQSLICPSWHQKKGLISLQQLIKQNIYENMAKILFKTDINQKMLYYYEQASLTLYGLALNGVIYKCDFRCMYNMMKNSFNFAKVSSISMKQLQNIQFQSIKFMVINKFMYVFIMKQAQNFISLFKARLIFTNENDPQIQFTQILANKIRSRKGYNICFVKQKQLIQDPCILVYGGTIEKVKHFKLLQIISLKGDTQTYNSHKIKVNEDNFRKISLMNPSFVLFKRYLVLYGGTDETYDPPRLNNSIIFISLHEEETLVFTQQLSSKYPKVNINHDLQRSVAVHNNRYLIISFRDVHRSSQINLFKIRRLQTEWEIQYIKIFFV